MENNILITLNVKGTNKKRKYLVDMILALELELRFVR